MISRLSKNNLADLLSPSTRIESPFVRVEIGGYTFGVYEGKGGVVNSNDMYMLLGVKYPNYVKSLEIQKINGLVNMYTLDISYPVTQYDDPNFFEKLFSSVSNSRKISITYGDSLLPNYIYRDEEALITEVTSNMDMKSSIINYTVKATSSNSLALSKAQNFITKRAKGSDCILGTIYDPNSGITDVFTGMKDRSIVEQDLLILGDDKEIIIPTFTNISPLEYIGKVANLMPPVGSDELSKTSPSVYTLTTYDGSDGKYPGPYFTVKKIETSTTTLDALCTYEIHVGAMSNNVVNNFSFKDQGGWSIYYNYSNTVDQGSDYVKRINDKGKLVDEYCPMMVGTQYNYKAEDKAWWTKVTQFTTLASMSVKGILRPAILMTYVKVNVWFYGRKHISSGYYIITSQIDRIDESGYWTDLELTRVAEDEGY